MRGLVVVLLLFLAAPTHAQRERPDIDISGAENTYVHAAIQDSEIILYAIYNEVSGMIRGYAVFNESESTASATVTFKAGDPLSFTVGAGQRVTESVAGRGYVMSIRQGQFFDENIASYSLGHTSRIRIARDRGPFPLPTER